MDFLATADTGIGPSNRWYTSAIAVANVHALADGLEVRAMLSAGCPPAEKKAPSSTTACARVGQSCEFAPGKLGTCVQKDGCNDPNPSACFVCQSQH